MVVMHRPTVLLMHRVPMFMPLVLAVVVRVRMALVGLHPVERHVANMFMSPMVWPPIRVVLRVLRMELSDRMAQM